MPEFTFRTVAMCRDAAHGKITNVGGFVQHFHTNGRATCTCPAGNATTPCDHIEEARELVCDYVEPVDGPPAPGNRCPKCGQPVVFSKWAE